MAYEPYNGVMLKDGKLLKMATVGAQYINNNNNLNIGVYTLGDNLAMYGDDLTVVGQTEVKNYLLKSGWRIEITARKNEGEWGITNDVRVFNPAGSSVYFGTNLSNVRRNEAGSFYVTAWYLVGGILNDGNSYIGYMAHAKIDDYHVYGYNSYLRSVSWGQGNFNGIWSDAGVNIDDPYTDAGTAGTGGGGGDFDLTSDPIDFPGLPTLSAVESGLVSIYAPTPSQMGELANFLWSNDFYDNILKLWADPMNVILGLSIVPVEVPTSSVQEITVGNVSTGVSMNKASSQYLIVDCGSINVNEYWGAYLDYSPYTKLSISVPYCGVYDLNIDEVMGNTIHVRYHIDVINGSCICYLKIGQSILYAYQGNISVPIPVTGENWSRAIQTAMSVAGTLISGGLTNAVGGGLAGVAGSALETAGAVTSMKPSVAHSGTFSGSGGALGIQYPYLILQRPRQCLPLLQNTFTGYPSYINSSLGNLKGFTKVADINLQNVACTDDERDEIINLLKRGVIL